MDAIRTKTEATETQKYIDELEADIMPIDNLISFATSDAGIQLHSVQSHQILLSCIQICSNLRSHQSKLPRVQKVWWWPHD